MRWIVESRNVHFRSLFKSIANMIIMRHVAHFSQFYNKGGVLINRYHRPIHIQGADSALRKIQRSLKLTFGEEEDQLNYTFSVEESLVLHQCEIQESIKKLLGNSVHTCILGGTCGFEVIESWLCPVTGGYLITHKTPAKIRDTTRCASVRGTQLEATCSRRCLKADRFRVPEMALQKFFEVDEGYKVIESIWERETKGKP